MNEFCTEFGVTKDGKRVARDHGFLVGAHNKHLDAALFGRDDRRIDAICAVVELKSDPVHVVADALADAVGVLTDAAAEDERIDPAQDGRHRAQFAANADHKVVDGLLRFGGAGGFQ